MAKAMKSTSSFAVCVDNRGYEASLEAGKLYRVLADRNAESRGYLRVIDESGEDYGYNAERFFPLAIPDALEEALTKPRKSRSRDRSSPERLP